MKSLFHGAYRKEVLDKVGLFNEEMIRTEDNEYHYRVRKAGYQICYDSEIRSYYQTRNSLKGMLWQKYLNGLWIGKTLLICPGCISVFHLVPFMFVAAILMTLLLGGFGVVWPAITLWVAYGFTNLGTTIMSVIDNVNRSIYCLLLPPFFLALHLFYGVGTMKGLFENITSKIFEGIAKK